MDTTTVSSCAALDESYISCITVDGTAILPPLMNEAKRAEMRHYRQLAIEKEQARLFQRKLNIMTRTNVVSDSDQSRPFTAPSSSSDHSSIVTSKMYLTSTPNSNKTFTPITQISTAQMAQNIINLMEAPKDDISINLPLSTSTSSSSLPKAADADQTESDTDTDDNNLASVASSAGTFIIKCAHAEQDKHHHYKSEGEVDDLEEDVEAETKEPQTVLRRPLSTTELIFKRKRPARYFENDTTDNEPEKIISSDDEPTGNTSSTSLSKYVINTTPTIFTPSVTTPALGMLPNTIEGGQTSLKVETEFKQSPTFTMNTNFAEAALSNTPRRSTIKGVRRTSSTSKSVNTSGHSFSPTYDFPLKTPSPQYDIVLSKEIPLSASKLRPLKDEDADENSNSDNSDKENRDSEKGKSKHVRKLSYTLLTPSASLLAATAASNKDDAVLFTIESAPPSSGIPSVQSTPRKETSTTEDDHSPELQTTTARLQHLHLGKGKKAHLERYLDEVGPADRGKTTPKHKTLHSDDRKDTDLISRIESEHKKQLDLLMIQYKKQTQKLREDFERERIKIFSELKMVSGSGDLIPVTTSENETTSYDPTVLADTSNLRNYYIPNETPTKNESHHVVGFVEGDVLKRGEFSSASDILYPQHVPPSPAGSTQEKIFTGGLSKFQNKMQKINPSLLKHPVDMRSPLLKGIVIPDPLERSIVVTKIPAQVNDSAMQPKFAKLSAAVKGFLTRRLLNTEKIQVIVQTIRDTVELLFKLYEENPVNQHGSIDIKEEDQGLHHRLIQQLTGACSSFHDIFFKISVKERMAIIANDREKIKARALKNMLTRGVPSPSKRNVSSATLKSIERRQTQSRSPGKKDNNRIRTSINSFAGSHSVKPKAVKSYSISSKRRRMSLWHETTEKQVKPNRASTVVISGSGLKDNADQKRPYTAVPARTTHPIPLVKTAYSARPDHNQDNVWGSETFLVPADAWSGHPNRQESRVKPKPNNSSKPPRSSISSRFSIGESSNASRSSSSRASVTVSRAPWKK